MENIIDSIVGFIGSALDTILSVLPTSPLQPVIASLSSVDWLGYVNYFVPVGSFVAIGSVWLTAIAVYYVYQVILRWLKVAGSA